MKKFLTFSILLLLKLCLAQPAPDDSLFFSQQVQDLIEQRQYATVQKLLEERIQQQGMKPVYVCLMVQNGLQHFYRKQNYHIFYLQDHAENIKAPADSLRKITTAQLRYPQRLLLTVIRSDPQNAHAYKLLGDFYNLQLQDLGDSEDITREKVKKLEENIFHYYSQADKLGVKDQQLNRWLGTYYLNSNQIDLAEKYYLRNITSAQPDAISYFRLAEIAFQQKQYTRGYNFAMRALQLHSSTEVYLRYDTIHLAAKCLKALGDVNKYLQFMQNCISLLPDMQTAYLELGNYYHLTGELAKAEKYFKQMLYKNPFDLKGFRALERFVLKEKKFYFADTLFEQLLLKYENWDEALANIYWSKGNLAHAQGLVSEANQFWEISRNYMRQYLPENSPVLKQVGKRAQKKKQR